VNRVRTPLNVIAIEDVIAEHVASWRTHRVPSAQATTLIQVLVALARRGIGARFRTGYLQQRSANNTGGEVAFETTWPGEVLSRLVPSQHEWRHGITFPRMPPGGG
jgi:hypothetical protein